MATALTDYFETKLGVYDNLIDGVSGGFAGSVDELAAATTDQGAAIDDLAALDSTIAQLRSDAAGGNQTPADIEDLADTLREALINRRNKQAQLLRLNERVQNAGLLKDNYADLLSRFRTLRTQCAAQGTAAEERGKQHSIWFSTDIGDALDAHKPIAATLLAEISATPDAPADPESEIAAQRVLIAAAHTRIEADIPEVLRDRARTRGSVLVDDYAEQIAGQMRDAEDAEVDFRAANDGDGGTLAKRWLEYDRAEAELRDTAVGTDGRMQRALSLLEKVRDATPLTSAERTRIADLTLAADAEAITTEADRDTAAAAVSAKKVELELAIVAALLADPTANPDDDTAVQTCQSELGTLEATLNTATTAHTDAFALQLDTWEVAVPDPIWQALTDYDAAIDALTQVAGVDLSAKRDGLTTAEAQLSAALGDDESNQQALAFAAAAVAAARERVLFIRRELGARRLSAVRGDA